MINNYLKIELITDIRRVLCASMTIDQAHEFLYIQDKKTRNTFEEEIANNIMLQFGLTEDKRWTDQDIKEAIGDLVIRLAR